MTKKVIAIISVLKPVDDTRNFEKVARSIGNTNKYDINIIGFSTKNIPSDRNITFHPIFNFRRNSSKRLIASILIFRKLLKLKPELIIVTTSELLIVSIVNKILFGVKIIYDVQENYYRNILYTNTYPPPLKYVIAFGVRTIELISSLFIDQYILAEKVYFNQMKYLSSKSEVIENKALIPFHLRQIKQEKNKELVFVYSGTIADHYGIFEAIDFIKNLKATIDSIHFIIIGYTAQDKTYKKIQKLIRNLSYIKIIGGNRLVPHSQILMEMEMADFCLLPYQTNKSTEGRIPTKLYECMAMEIPVIISPNPAWDSIIKENNAGIIYDFNSKSPQLSERLQNQFYGNNISFQSMWESSSDKITEIVQNII